MGFATGLTIQNAQNNFKNLDGKFSQEIASSKTLDYAPYLYKFIGYHQERDLDDLETSNSSES